MKDEDLVHGERPGVPMELRPRRVGEAHWDEPPVQARTVRVYKHAEREELTPVYGTDAPPRGLSGLLRRWAYGVPEQRPRHFLLLLLADRVDFVEHTLVAKIPFAAAAVLVGGIVARKAVRAARRERR